MHTLNSTTITGAGLGLRRSLLNHISNDAPQAVNFFEVAPENWINIGGKLGKQFRSVTEQYPFICHGLSLSLGSVDPLDEHLIQDIKAFMRQHGMTLYSEHLSYCSHGGHLYDLLPIPFTEEAVQYVAARIRRVQDILEQKIALENVSYYALPSQEMTEIEFFNAVIDAAECDILLDVNNIYVNSVNHNYDADSFLKAIPAERIAYLHVAGHYQQADNFLIDTHGANVIDPVWKLLGRTYELYGVLPTLLERDFNVPPLVDLLTELASINSIQTAWTLQHAQQSA